MPGTLSMTAPTCSMLGRRGWTSHGGTRYPHGHAAVHAGAIMCTARHRIVFVSVTTGPGLCFGIQLATFTPCRASMCIVADSALLQVKNVSFANGKLSMPELRGGKLDDITVVVAYIGETDIPPPASNGSGPPPAAQQAADSLDASLQPQQTEPQEQHQQQQDQQPVQESQQQQEPQPA